MCGPTKVVNDNQEYKQNVNGVKKPLKKIDEIDDVARKGSGQPKSKVEEMFLSKMNKISLEFILDSRNCT